jgi:tartronate-semialdehyde synthase
MQRKTSFDVVPIKPQRVYQEMNKAFGRTHATSRPSGSRRSRRPAAPRVQAAALDQRGQAGPLGWTLPAALGVADADPDSTVVALSGDYDFQFLLEELAVGAQFKIPYIHVVVNNAYLG